MSEDRTIVSLNRKCPLCQDTFGADFSTCPKDGTLLMPIKQNSLIGSNFAGKYRITEELGRGGMSIVYKGVHEIMHRHVAIKIMQAELLSDAASVRRFQQESEAASRLAHPHVVTVFDFGVTDSSQPYLVMDLVEGTSLADAIKKEGSLSPQRAIHIFEQICAALDHAHHRGVVHRDLKPGNIMLTHSSSDHDFVKVVDFGIAKLVATSEHEPQKLTKDGEIFGSPLYMSPEQCRGALLDHRTDVYATGIMLYEALTGKMPLVGSSFFDTMQMHISTPAKPFSAVVPQLKLSPSLEAIVFKAIEKKPEERYQSMREFDSALQNVKRQLGFNGGITDANTDQKPVTSKNTVLLPIVIGAILMCAVAAFITSKLSTPSRLAPDEFIKGTIWFYDPLHKPGLIWIYNRSNGLRTIYTGDSRLENTTPDAVKAIRNGAEWGVTFHGVNETPTLEEKGTKFTGTFDKDIVAVDTLIRDHYEEMASGEYEKAYKEFSPLFVNLPPEKKLIEDWKKTKWKKGCSHAPIAAIKFMAQTQVSITAQVVASYFLEGAHENWSIVFSKDAKALKTENPWKFQSLDWVKASEATDARF